MKKLFVGIAPFGERQPIIGRDSRGMILDVGSIWENQLDRTLKPLNDDTLNQVTILLGRSVDKHAPGFEVIITIWAESRYLVGWLHDIEHCIPQHWDKTSLVKLEKLGWLVNMRRGDDNE